MMQEKTIEIVAAKTRAEFFAEMYEEAFPNVARFVASHGGTVDDAKDIFQDALVIYYELSLENKLSVQISDRAYLNGIAKHVWIRKYKKDQVAVSLDGIESAIELPSDYFEPYDQNLLTLLEQAGKRCLDLMRAFYYDRLSLNQISKSFGFSGVRSATVQKFKCIEKMRAIVKENSINYEDLA
jgi:DNA-directed RNA polymerase specialized sigma24 family protein